MTIDEAIKHAREVAEYKREMAEGLWRKKLNNPDFPWGRDYTKEEVERKEKECVLRAEEHEQLAEWLEELKDLREYKVKVEWVIKTHKQIKAETIDKCIEIVSNADVDILPSSEVVLRELEKLKEIKND